MEKMDSEYSTLFENVVQSVVIVDQIGRIDLFCIGSIILSDGENTFILTQTKISDPPGNLSVRFFNGFNQPATLLSTNGELCILKTNFYPKTKEVKFFGGEINHQHAATIAPSTKFAMFYLPGFITQKSLELCRHDGIMISDSEDYFTFACRYGDKSSNFTSRLISGPVFTLNGEVAGVVVGDMEYKIFPQKTASLSTVYHKEYYVQAGFFLKVAIHVSKLQEMFRSMTKMNDWRNGLKQMARDMNNQSNKGKKAVSSSDAA